VTVSLVTETPGATVRFTTDGSDPHAGAPVYSAPLLIETATVLRARAFAEGYEPSPVMTAEYTVDLVLAAPSVEPPGGTYATPLQVTMAGPAGAALRCTLDGSEPTEVSALYTGPLSVATATDLAVRAFKPGWSPSPVTRAAYRFNYGTLAPPALAPTSGTYVTSVGVTLSGPPEASVHFTTDGSSPTVASPLYDGPFTLTASATVRAASFRPDWTPSAPAEAVYEVKVATPSFDPPSGSYSSAQDVAITTSTPGATITYTTDGAEPTPSDPSLAPGQTVRVDHNGTLHARAWKAGATPSDIASATYIIATGQVAGGGNHSLALTDGGDVWAWGYNGNGQLGDGTVTQRLTAVRVSLLTGVSGIAAGSSHSLARRTDGTLWAWGYNAHGELGDGTTTQRPTPVPVPGLSGVVSMDGGQYHSVAAKNDGTVWAWGYNANGQLGDGTTTTRTSPVQVGVVSGVVGFAAGSSHTLALKSDGTVWAWGYNANGQLGDGTTAQRLSPVQVAGLTDVVAVAGESHSMALKSDGTVWAWGYNAYGQLGDGTTTQRLTPVQVAGLSDVVAVAGGLYHSYALKSDGTVWAWGNNGSGQLGDGTTTLRRTPVPVGTLPAIGAIGAGDNHGLAIGDDRSAWAWGTNYYGQLGDGTNLTRPTPVRIAEAGFAWKAGTPTFNPAPGTYGANQNVTLACATSGAEIRYTTDGSDPTPASALYSSAIPVTVSTTLRARAFKVGLADSNPAEGVYTLKVATPSVSPGGGTYTTAQSVTIAMSTSGAQVRYTTDGSAPTSGSPLYTGPLPIGTTTTLQAAGFKDGWATSDVRSATYTMNFGTLAAPTLTPAPGTYIDSVAVTMEAVEGAEIRYTTNGVDPTTASTLYTGPPSLSQTTTLKAKAWKIDYTTSPVTTAAYTIQVAAPELSLASGSYPAGTTVTVTGANAGATLYYTLNGNDPTTSDPVIVSGGSLILGGYTLEVRAFRSGCTASDVTAATYTVAGQLTSAAVAGGGDHSVALTDGGDVWAWGYNGYGQLGDGTVTQRLTPVRVSLLTGVSGIAAGPSHSLARTTDGTLWAWGYNGHGELGDGTTTQRTTPVPVPGLSGVVSMDGGQYHSVAAMSDGTVWAWGYNTNGQLGDGTTTQRTSPVQVGAVSGVVVVSAGSAHTLAVKSDGTVWAWGYNGYGQLGDGTTTQRLSPVQVAGLTDVVAVAGGQYHSMAVKSDGTVWAWGYNGYRQLGDGTTAQRLTPVRVVGLTDVAAVASGHSHSYALRSDGTVWAWGYNAYGQMGDGTMTQRLTPVPVGTLPAIGAIGAGDNYGLAIGVDRSAWAWGNNSNGQLGDGTHLTRPTPVKIAEAGFAWMTATPVLTPASGSYSPNESFQVTVTVASAGATIHYTLDGMVPDETSPTVASGGKVTFSLNETRVLRARALQPGMAAGNVASATYVPQLATPVLSLPSGTYVAGESVAVTQPNTGATMHYTLNGGDPTESDPVIESGGRLRLDYTATLSVRSFRASWATSATAFMSYTIKPAGPVATPPGGEYDGPLLEVVLSCATPGVTIHYKLTHDLSSTEPTQSDPAVPPTGVVRLEGEAQLWRLRARAFKAGLAPSDTVAADYWLRPVDTDGDGLPDTTETALGSDPHNADTNADGLPDGAAYAAGLSVTSDDMDGDGVANQVERDRGTDPFRADSDGDGVSDAADAFPLDPSRWQPLPPQAGDTTPPVITLTEPTSAILVSSVP
jgi:alpha-tubulin suppressor-like RCC1 family protein